MTKIPITSTGFRKLEQEIKHLKYTIRPQVTAAISEAREHGDLSENAEYHAARDMQSRIESRIIDLEDKIARADVIEASKLSGTDTIKFGAQVELLDLDTDKKVIYQIVGEYEANIQKGLISIMSPTAKALIGKKVDNIIDVSVPKGEKSYKILKIEYC